VEGKPQPAVVESFVLYGNRCGGFLCIFGVSGIEWGVDASRLGKSWWYTEAEALKAIVEETEDS